MSRRVTRSSAARLAADTPSPDATTTTTDIQQNQFVAHEPSPPTRPTSSRKRKAAAAQQSPQDYQETGRLKRARAEGRSELNAAEPASVEGPKRGKRRSTIAAMSSAGYADDVSSGEGMVDASRPSSSNSEETTPQNAPKDSSKRKSNRRKSKDDPSPSALPPISRKSKRGSRKDHDTIMMDTEEKTEEPGEELPEEHGTRQDAGAGADGSDDASRRLTDDDMDRLGPGDPFSGGYLSRLAGHSGFAGLSGHLRALSGMTSSTGSRLRSILEQLRTKDDPSIQLIALQELSELLLVSNEDNLAGHFAPDQFVKELVTLMQPNDFTGEENPEMMLLACRCIANLMEALPAATASVVYGGAVPILCQKLLEIHFIDLAEQALSTLEKISVEFPSSIVREGGLTACLTYLEFFATSTQRTAVTTAANCCRNIPEDSFPTVRDVMPILLNTLSSSDQRVVEQASLCVSRIIDSFKYAETKLEELVSAELLQAILRLLLPGSTNMISPRIHTSFLRVLSITARASPHLSVELLKMNVVDTLYQILTGVSPPTGSELDVAAKIDKNVIMQAIIRTPREQIFETLNVICEILPTVSRDGLMFLDHLHDAGYTGPHNVSMSTRSKKAPNDKRLELLKDCSAEVKRFAVVLFPMLMHAYTSTVNLNVRQKVLTAQLKMLSNFDTDILEEALSGVAYASHLASILSQQENPTLVTYALQAAELLLKRLESIYRQQFYREGVMAEIERLANRLMKAVEVPPEKVEPTHALGSAAEAGGQISRSELQPGEPPAALEMDMTADASEDDEHQEENEDENVVLEENDEDQDEDHDDDDADDDDRSEPSEPSEPRSEGQSLQRPRIVDVQDVITLRAKGFMDAHGHERSEELRSQAAHVLDDLRNLADKLTACYSGMDGAHGTELFHRLAKYFDGDANESITSYELMTSGIVEVLLTILNAFDEQAQTEARRDFIEVFMTSMPTVTIATGSAASPTTAFSVLVHKLQEVLSRAEHFEVITVHHNAFESNRVGAASMLAKQLRLQLVANDDSGIPKAYRRIMVSIHAIATFKALDDYLRPRISLSDRPRGGRSGRDGGLSGAMAAYAAAMSGRERHSGGPPPPPSVPSLGSSLPTRSTPSAKRSSRNKSSKSDAAEQVEVAPTDEPKSLRRSSRRQSTLATPKSQGPPAAASSGNPLSNSEDAQDPLECADEAHISEDEDDDVEAELDALVDDLEEGALEQDEPDPSAVNMEVGISGKVTARTDDGARISTPSQGTPTPAAAKDRMMNVTARLAAAREMLSIPTGGSSSRPMSYASALQQVPQDWHIEFSINGQPIANDTTIYRACHFNQGQSDELSGRSIWSATHTISYKRAEGPPPESSTLTPPPDAKAGEENGSLPPSLAKHPVTAGILRLMSILHDLNANLDEVLTENKHSLKLNSEPLTQFVNTKLTAKLNRQLEEPLIVASNCLPSWSEDLARLFPFLFPFETRHLFLSSTSFGYSRSMNRWQSSQPEVDGRHSRHRDERPFLGRLQRQKVRISRNRILESAIKVMEMYGSSPSVLEVEYFEEVGTGLGPTLEFYSTVSKEFSKKKIKLWRENESQAGDEYAFGRKGLFPTPMTNAMSKTETGQRVLHLFKMLGKFVARSMLDSRIIDISFNPTFFRVGDTSLSMNTAAVATVDHDLAHSLKFLKKLASTKQRILDDGRLTEAQKKRKIEEIRVNDMKLEDLALDFTLPGHEQIELIPDGANTVVSLDNVSAYITNVIDMTIGSGVQKQLEAFRAGFSQVFPYSALKAFTPDELVMLFGRVNEDWSLETLMDSIKADHGYNLDSKSVRNLLQVMSELSVEDRRGFLQFVSGSPKLPIGGEYFQCPIQTISPDKADVNPFAGFKSLTPMFTVVCKPSDPPYSSDDYLPSVMTCVNYLKMPDYSSLEVLKDKLNVAVMEGQGSFHLS